MTYTCDIKNNSRHRYEYSVDINSDSAPANVIRMVGNDKYVLEIGAGPGSITKYLHTKGNCNIIAIEIDETAIPRLETYCEIVYQSDLNDSNWPAILKQKKFDVVVAADVLEHVYDPWSTLKIMKSLLKEGGNIVASLPHVGHSAILACLLDEDFNYRDWGLLDRTHIRFFGLKNMQSLFNEAGLNIIEAKFIILKPELCEFSSKWRKLPLGVRKTLASFKHGNIYQVVVKAVPSTQASMNIHLMKLAVDKPTLSKFDIINIVAHKLLPEKFRIKLRNILNI